jgi:hypothetical protein
MSREYVVDVKIIVKLILKAKGVYCIGLAQVASSWEPGNDPAGFMKSRVFIG